MMHVQRRIAKGIDVLDYYANNAWEFDNTHCLNIFKLLNAVEAKKYFVAIHEIDKGTIERALRSNILGTRRYLLNEPDETLPSSRRLLKM
jgi:fatty acyl-CoA reductase